MQLLCIVPIEADVAAAMLYSALVNKAPLCERSAVVVYSSAVLSPKRSFTISRVIVV
jgi:hypothetical protein